MLMQENKTHVEKVNSSQAHADQVNAMHHAPVYYGIISLGCHAAASRNSMSAQPQRRLAHSHRPHMPLVGNHGLPHFRRNMPHFLHAADLSLNIPDWSPSTPVFVRCTFPSQVLLNNQRLLPVGCVWLVQLSRWVFKTHDFEGRNLRR